MELPDNVCELISEYSKPRYKKPHHYIIMKDYHDRLTDECYDMLFDRVIVKNDRLEYIYIKTLKPRFAFVNY
jgi:hypothetical protein